MRKFWGRWVGRRAMLLAALWVGLLWVGLSPVVLWAQVAGTPELSPGRQVIRDAADPFVTRGKTTEGQRYLLLATHENTITIWSGKQLGEVAGNPKVLWKPGADGQAGGETAAMKQIWSPTLWRMWGKWWIYFTAEYPGGKHGIYVLESVGDDPLGEYVFRGKMGLSKEAIDPSVLVVAGTTYLMYVDVEPKRQDKSGDTGGWNAVWITRLDSPLKVRGDGVELIHPDQPWEMGAGTTHNYPVAEGPTALYHQDKTYVVYSGSDTGTHVYCLGLMTYRGGDPMRKANWVKSGPVFSFSEEHGVYGPGRGSFTTVGKGKHEEEWMAYHAKSVKEYTYAGRSVRFQRFRWAPDGAPVFGVAGR